MSKDIKELGLDCRKSRGLTSRIACFLEQEMKDGLYPKGTKLPSEANLIQKYGVSRPVIREALRYLEAKDLVSIQHGIGAISMGWKEPQETRLLNPLKNHYTELEAIEINQCFRVFRALAEGMIKLSILTLDHTCRGELDRLALELEEANAEPISAREIIRQHLDFYNIMAERCDSEIHNILMKDLTQNFTYFFDHPDRYGPLQNMPLNPQIMKEGLQTLMRAIADGHEAIALKCLHNLEEHIFSMLEIAAKQEA